MINLLPIDILENISINFLDHKSYVNLYKTNKRMLEYLDNNNYIWKKKLEIEYNSIVHTKPKRITWKKFYIRLKLNNCIECHKKTVCTNEFYDIKLCRSCERSENNPKYHMISYTSAKRRYFLNNDDLKDLSFIIRTMNVHGKNIEAKLFLKNDILGYIKDKYGYYKYTDLVNNKISHRTNSNISMLIRYNMFNNILLNHDISSYDIIFCIMPNIISYSDSLYYRYLKGNKNVVNNPALITQLITMCMELLFIINYTSLDWKNFQNFNDLLKYHIITNTNSIFPLPIQSSLQINNGGSSVSFTQYIDRKISQFIRCNTEVMKRRNNVLDYYMFYMTKRIDTANILEIPLIYDYIYYGNKIHLYNSLKLSNRNYYSNYKKLLYITNIINCTNKEDDYHLLHQIMKIVIV